MGFEKLINFLERNLSYDAIEELKLKSSIKKILCEHVFYDINFIIYSCMTEVEAEVNDIIKIIYSLPFNYDSDVNDKVESFFKLKHWNECDINEEVLNGLYENDIVDNFKKMITQEVEKNILLIDKVLYHKVVDKIIESISSLHLEKFVISINLFFDGIPSFSKILEQKRRRSKNYLESQKRKKNFKKYFKCIENDLICENDITYNYFSWLNNKFNIDKSLGPTSDKSLLMEQYIYDKLKLHYTDKKIYICSGKEYGESDTKIFSYIHQEKIKDNIVIHTCDSDLIHQIITQQVYSNINKLNINYSIIRYYSISQDYVQFIHGTNIVNLILQKYKDICKIKEEINEYKIVLDLMVYFYFFGNDNLPSCLEIGYELNLNFVFKSHYKCFNNKNFLVDISNGKNSLNINSLATFLNEIKEKKLALIVLVRFYKIHYNLVSFLVDKMNFNLKNLIPDFLIPYFIYEGYVLMSDEQTANLEKEDLRYIHYNKYKIDNHEPPVNPLDLNKYPESFKKIIIEGKKLLDKNIDFYDSLNMGLTVYNKKLYLEGNSYQDLYNYLNNISIKETQTIYPQFYRPYPYKINKIDNIYDKYPDKSDDIIESYLKMLYVQVDIFFNDMSNYNPCNFIYYPDVTPPKIQEIVNFINSKNTSDLYKKWNNDIKENTVPFKKYFDSVSHHIFITPYLRNSDFIKQIKYIKNLYQILEELYKLQGSLWLEEYNEEYNYRNIDPKKFLYNWKEALIKVNLKHTDYQPLISDENSYTLLEFKETDTN